MKNIYSRIIFVLGIVLLYKWYTNDPKDFMKTIPVYILVAALVMLVLFLYQKKRNSKD